MGVDRLKFSVKNLKKKTYTRSSSNDSIIDTNVAQSNISGGVKINLSLILSKIVELTQVSISDHGLMTITLKNAALKEISFKTPLFDIQKFFNTLYFPGNFNLAFQEDLPTTMRCSMFSDLTVTIANDLNNSVLQSSISLDELHTFRFLCCVFFGLIFNLSLKSCACYPKTLSELNAVNAGIGINCISLECKNRLLMFPDQYDELMCSDCSDFNFQGVFVSISAFAAGNITFNNLNIKQTISCLSST